jgi:hypothetical protein
MQHSDLDTEYDFLGRERNEAYTAYGEVSTRDQKSYRSAKSAIKATGFDGRYDGVVWRLQ